MTITHSPDHETESPRDELKALVAYMQERIDLHVATLGKTVDELSAHEREKLLGKLSAILAFELEHSNVEQGVGCAVTGYGCFAIAENTEDDLLSGNILGSEQISDGDLLIGKVKIMAVGIYPSQSMVVRAQAEGSTIDESVISVVPVLQNARFYTGMDLAGGNVQMHDLGDYIVHPIAAHQLNFDTIS